MQRLMDLGIEYIWLIGSKGLVLRRFRSSRVESKNRFWTEDSVVLWPALTLVINEITEDFLQIAQYFSTGQSIGTHNTTCANLLRYPHPVRATKDSKSTSLSSGLTFHPLDLKIALNQWMAQVLYPLAHMCVSHAQQQTMPPTKQNAIITMSVSRQSRRLLGFRRGQEIRRIQGRAKLLLLLGQVEQQKNRSYLAACSPSDGVSTFPFCCCSALYSNDPTRQRSEQRYYKAKRFSIHLSTTISRQQATLAAWLPAALHWIWWWCQGRASSNSQADTNRTQSLFHMYCIVVTVSSSFTSSSSFSVGVSSSLCLALLVESVASVVYLFIENPPSAAALNLFIGPHHRISQWRFKFGLWLDTHTVIDRPNSPGDNVLHKVEHRRMRRWSKVEGPTQRTSWIELDLLGVELGLGFWFVRILEYNSGSNATHHHRRRH